MKTSLSLTFGDQRLITVLRRGGVGVLPTDTIYGLVGQALRPKVVERIYRIRERNLKKPCIVLISSLRDLKLFGVRIDSATAKILRELWPDKVSVILPCLLRKFSYLHRGTKTIAFRFPKKRILLELLKKTGPLIAPSANLEGLKPANSISAAKKYFGDRVDFYVDSGKLKGRPSTLIRFRQERPVVLRPGAVKI